MRGLFWTISFGLGWSALVLGEVGGPELETSDPYSLTRLFVGRAEHFALQLPGHVSHLPGSATDPAASPGLMTDGDVSGCLLSSGSILPGTTQPGRALISTIDHRAGHRPAIEGARTVTRVISASAASAPRHLDHRFVRERP